MERQWKAIHELVRKKEKNICEITALKDNRIVYSDSWNNYSTKDAFHVMSVTKSVVSLLIGIAIDEGYIKSVEQNVLEFFPEYEVKEGKTTVREVKIKHLLTMTAPYSYRLEPWRKVCTSNDWTKAALDLLGGKKGFTGKFVYATLGIQILMGIIARASKMTTLEFANRYLFTPLELEEREDRLDTTAKEQMTFFRARSSFAKEWYREPAGVNTAGWGLCMTAEEMARIGQLCLDHGVYQDKRIISKEWIQAMTTSYYQCDRKFGWMQYGYLWWLIDETQHSYAAIGDGGNVIYVNPAKQVVITVAATMKPRVYDRVDFIRKNIEPLL